MTDGILAAGFGGSGGTPGTGSWTVLVIYFCLAIGISFVCSVLEAVLLSVTGPYVAHLRKERPKVGKTLEDLKAQISRPLASILTLNTCAHTVGSMGVASQVTALGGGAWDALAGALMTLAILIASEIIPKNLGARYWRQWAPALTVVLKWFTTAMTPVVWFIELFSRGGHIGVAFSREELKVMAEMGRREGKLHEDESRILHNLLQLRENSVRDVMTPRVVVFALQEGTTVGEFLAHHSDCPFSRIPIFRQNRDEIGAFVLKGDVLLAAARDEDDKSLADFSRELPSLPGMTSLTHAFDKLVTVRNHMALVLDEYGGVEGLVTMEDIVETLLGLEIMDEVDTREDMQAWARSLWKRRAQKMGLTLDPPKSPRPESQSENAIEGEPEVGGDGMRRRAREDSPAAKRKATQRGKGAKGSQAAAVRGEPLG